MPDRGRGIPSDKNGACVFSTVGYAFRLGHQNFNMRSRQMIDEIDRGLLIRDDESHSSIYNRSSSERRTIQRFELDLNLVEYGGSGLSRPTDKPNAGHLIMLCLRKQIGGNPRWIARLVGDERDLAGSGDHVNIDDAEN